MLNILYDGVMINDIFLENDVDFLVCFVDKIGLVYDIFGVCCRNVKFRYIIFYVVMLGIIIYVVSDKENFYFIEFF